MRICKVKRGGKTVCVYVGRECHGYGASPLGNPFVVGKHGTRSVVIEAYRRWLWERIQANDAAVMAALRSLKDDDVLGCWCCDMDDAATPGELKCHAQVIGRCVKWLKNAGRE